MANMDLILQVVLKRIQELPDPKVPCSPSGLGIGLMIVTALAVVGGFVWLV